MTGDKLTPRVDLAFKKLFGVEENKDLLISLINAIVSEEDQVADITLLNPYNVQNFRNDKLSILDIKAQNRSGGLYNIEIQVAPDADYDKRALYYWAKLYTDQLQKSEGYSSLKKAIGIHILNFHCVPGTQKYHNVFQLKEKETDVHYFENIELHTIELSKFEGKLKEEGDERAGLLKAIQTSLGRWMAFLTHHERLAYLTLNDPEVEKALGVMDQMNLVPQERDLYDGHLKWLWTEAAALKTVFDEGEAIGIERGREEGSQLKALEIAKAMLAKGMDVKIVSDLTGLPMDEIQGS
jgi:predicted transposase/invertase (TIGR01784 family)